MKRVLVDKILLIIIAIACCILVIPSIANLSPYWMLISIPFFWLGKIINKKYPNFPELHQSAACGDKEKLLELITLGVDANTKDNYDLKITVKGGGSNGQAEAVRLAISRALCKINDDFRSELKPEGLLTRDPRMVERKKFGQKKARKKFQFSKR